MRKLFVLLLIGVCFITLVACAEKPSTTQSLSESPTPAITGTIKNGIYIQQGEETGPYICLYTDNLSWYSYITPLASFARGGTYQINGTEITAKTNTEETVLVFEILSDSEIILQSIKDPENSISWMKEGEHFIFTPAVSEN